MVSTREIVEAETEDKVAVPVNLPTRLRYGKMLKLKK
jgi:hypothetical protein